MSLGIVLGIQTRLYLPSRQYDDAASMHLSKPSNRSVKLSHISRLFSSFLRISKRFGFICSGHEPVDRRCNDTRMSLLLQHFHAYMYSVLLGLWQTAKQKF